ncbi:S49 family peptidase [Endothiovibrio diazotrophicus]
MSDEWTSDRPKGEERKPGWEREMLEKLAFAAVTEQRRARRWGIFFKLALLAYFVAALAMFSVNSLNEKHLVDGKHTAVVRVDGIIAADSKASADKVIAGLRDAFEDQGTEGVILKINSPGGSPVQAGYVYDEIKRLREEYPEIPLYAVVADMCASGGYYIAAAADRIYADKASVVGSIGVLMDGFGFVGSMEKLGVERRLMTSGEHKGMLDPFSPSDAEESAHMQTLLEAIHRQFIDAVKQGRGDRLKGDEKTLFSGLFWTGEQAQALGLVDELAGPDYVAREVIGAEETVDFSHKREWIDRFADRIGATGAHALLQLVGSAPEIR